MAKSSRMLQLLNHRLRIVTQDGKSLVGQMIAFDKHMNLVLADCNEYRTLKQKKTTQEGERTEKRHIGLVILRGEEVVSFVVESGPPPSAQEPGASLRVPASASLADGARGGAFAKPSSTFRGASMTGNAVPALNAPIRGVGGPSPYAAAQPMPYGRPPMMPGMHPQGPPMPGMPPMMPGMHSQGPPMPGMPPMMPGMHSQGPPMPGMPPMMQGMPPMVPGMPPMMPGMHPQGPPMPGMPPAMPGMLPMMPGMPFPPPPPSSQPPSSKNQE